MIEMAIMTLGSVIMIITVTIARCSFLSLAGSSSPIILKFMTLVTMNDARAMKMEFMVNRYSAPSMKRNWNVASP